MNIDFIKVPFSNNPSMQKYDGPLFNVNPDKKYLFEKHLQFKKYGKDLFGQTEQYEHSDLNQKVSQTLGLEATESLLETAMQIEEDLAVMHNGKLEAICFCFPSGWIPGNELKADLSKLHQPVADNELLLKSSKKLAQHMNKQTIRRWVWNITTVPGLSNHPSEERPLLNDFENLYFRLETQISTPLDEFSSLFLVKVNVVPLKDLWDDVILESINSMSDSVINYKNLAEIKNFLNKLN
tara:strand:+ start:501 stop:1217 length:717 start_codon:yes stop_codon:yes gene_type:complete